ncbi:MAG: hypothetical protein WKG07_09070 [Hymenobacter sp.]
MQQGSLSVPDSYQAACRRSAGRASLSTPARGRPLVRASTTYAPCASSPSRCWPVPDFF